MKSTTRIWHFCLKNDSHSPWLSINGMDWCIQFSKQQDNIWLLILLSKSIAWRTESCSAFEKTSKQKHNTKSVSSIKMEFVKNFGGLTESLPICRIISIILWIIWLHLVLLYSIYHWDCDLSCYDIRDHQSRSQKTCMLVHDLLQHIFLLDINDF